MTERPGEFDLIQMLFAPLAKGAPGALGLKDDTAFLTPPEGCDLVLTKDAIVEGVHFRPGDPAGRIAQKLARVNLSDLAAKGAKPLGYLLATAFRRDTDTAWMQAFAAGLGEDQAEFGWTLMGGDTVATPGPLTFSLTAIGTVPTGQMIRRSGARVGDEIWVTGTIGDSGLGLKVLDGALEAGSDGAFLADRYLLPRPRVTTGGALHGVASACVDVSDGLIADASHLAEASGVALEIEADLVPLSPAAAALLASSATSLEALFTAGDDFELCFTAAPECYARLMKLSENGDVALTRIGRVVEGEGTSLLSAKGEKMPMNASGYNHFAR